MADATIIQPKQFARGAQEQEAAAPETQPVTSIDDLPLKEIAYGEELLGTLTDEEADLFVQFYNANEEAHVLNRDLTGGMLVAIGQDVRSGRAEDQGYELNTNIDPADARRFFQASALANRLKAELFWSIGERFGAHDWSCGIRSKRRIVKIRRKW